MSRDIDFVKPVNCTEIISTDLTFEWHKCVNIAFECVTCGKLMGIFLSSLFCPTGTLSGFSILDHIEQAHAV